MVWRKIIISAMLLFALATPLAARANAAEMNMDLDALTFAQEFSKSIIDFSDKYLFVITGERSFQLYVGDIVKTTSGFEANEVTCYTMHFLDDSNVASCGIAVYNNWSMGFPPFFYSNVSSQYLDFMDKEVTLLYATLIILGIGLICYLLRSIFSFCLRRKG